MKSNGLVVLILIYIAFFGIKIDMGIVNENSGMSKCKPIDAPVLKSPPAVPVIDKVDLENKDYVIRILIKHIKNQNTYITDSNIQASKLYNTYTKCAIE